MPQAVPGLRLGLHGITAPRTSGAADNKGSISKDTWVEYNVTALVTGNGTYSFVLAGDSNDNVILSSREGSDPPQLVLTFASSRATATATAAPSQTRTPTATQASGPTPTRTPTIALSATATFTRTPTAANPTTTSAGGTFTFLSSANSYVESSNPGTNYGSATQITRGWLPGCPQLSALQRTGIIRHCGKRDPASVCL